MRTFIAIDICDKAKKEVALLEEGLKKAHADVKWVKVENVHLTLKFLGEVAEEKIKDISGILDGIASEYSKFDITLSQIGAFPKLDYPRVVWVGIEGNSAALKEIAAKVDEGCTKIGFEKEKRPFSAHITLGRVRSPKNKRELKEAIVNLSITPLTSSVDELVLYQSVLTPQGPVYTKIHKSKLST